MAQPAYLEVYLQIKNKILQGVYSAGDFLPIEPELEQTYNVSRTTVRKAMKMLADEGLIEIKQGRGTMVLDRKTPQNFNHVTSVTETLIQSGYTVTTKSRYVDKITPPESVAKALRLKNDEMVVRVQRIQLANGEPVCIMTNYIPESLVPDMEKKHGEFTGLYHYLEQQYGISIDNTEDTIFAAAADFTEAQILNIPPGFPLLIVERVCYDANKKPLCFDKVRILSNRYKVQVSTAGRIK